VAYILLGLSMGYIFMALRRSLSLEEVTESAKTYVSDQDIRKTWILFGDPTIKFK
jgi:hypothetical protein